MKYSVGIEYRRERHGGSVVDYVVYPLPQWLYRGLSTLPPLNDRQYIHAERRGWSVADDVMLSPVDIHCLHNSRGRLAPQRLYRG